MLSSLLNAVVSDIAGLGLAGSAPVSVVKRKGVKQNPTADQTYQITVDLAENGSRTENVAFGQKTSRYLIDVTLTAPNQDWSTDLDTYTSWYESISSLFRVPTLLTTTLWNTTSGSSKVWDVKVILGTSFDRDAMAQAQLDLQSLQLEVGVTA